MDYLALLGISFGLAGDAFAAAVSEGALQKNLKIYYALELSFFFGFFQSAMPVIGWIIGKSGENILRYTNRLAGFGILAVIGIKMIWDYLDMRKSHTFPSHGKLSLKTVIFLALATSIDALASGIILPSSIGADTLPLLTLSAGTIGIITFCVSLSGVYIGKFFGCMFSQYAELFGGCMLIVIGLKILFSF